MSFINDFPYTDFHELNLDWFLKKFKDLTNLVYNIEKKLTEKIDKIPSNLSNIICVNDYGAKGDGVTDDTVAIQKCLDNNPSAHIFFKKGIYVISDTLKIHKSDTGVCLDLGGSVLMFSDNAPFPNREKPMILTDLSESITSANTIIKNGTLNGNSKCGIGIQNTTYYCIISDIRLVNFRYIGILTGELNGVNTISSQALYNNITINQIEGDWSLDKDTHGMFFINPDNIVNNVNINRYSNGITIRTGGNEFNNIHTTIQYRKNGLMDNEYQGVNINHFPLSSGQKQINTFNNCYFNGGRYIVKNTINNYSQSTVLLNNCQYTFYSSSTVLGENLNCYVLGGDYPCYIHADSLESHHGEKCTLIGCFTKNYSLNSTFFSDIKCYGDATYRGDIFDIQNGGKNAKSILANYNLSSKKWIKIGCVLRKISISSTENNGNSELSVLPFSGVRKKTSFYRESNVWNKNSDSSFSKIEFYIDNDPTTVVINDKNYHIFYLYMTNISDSTVNSTVEIDINGVISNEYYLYPIYYDFMLIDNVTNVTKIL